jgi:RHS repeat-associated protein
MYLIGGKTADSATGNFTDSSMIYEYDVDTNSWQTKGNLSLPRRNLAAVYMGNKIFAIGGENSGKTDFVEVYDPVGNTVTTQASLPIALSNIYATEFLGVIFVYDPDSGKVYKYDADNNQWQAVVPLGQAHGNLLTTISSNMYCLGYDSATSTTPIIYKYSLPDNTWGDYTTFNTYGNIKNIVSLNNSIYIFTALSGDYVTGMVTYTPPATPWFIKSSMPQSNGCMGTAALGDKIYVAGGLKSIGEYYGIVPDNALWEYDTVHDTWEMKASMNYARAHLGLVAANNKLYAIGGQGDNGCVPYVEEYDPEADTWTVKNTTGPAIHSMAVTNYNNNIYVFGGIESFYSDILNKAWKYDPIADNWTSLKTMPSMRCACAAAAIDGTIYIAGGLIAAGENGIEVYDIATNQWNTKESLSNTSIVYGIYPAMVAAKGKLYFAAYSVGMYGYPSMEPIFCEIDPVTGIVIDDLIGPPLNTISMGMVATDFGIYVLGGVEPSSYGLEGIFYGLISKCYKDVYFSPIEDAKPEYNDYIHMGKTEVNLSGNFSRTYTDMEVSVPGFNMKISRTYNSHDAREGTLGKSWTFGFEGTLEHVGNKIIARLPDGSGYTFYTNGSKIPWSQGSTDTKFVAADNRAILDKISDVTYILTTKDQYRYGFFDGYLTWMEDRNGNRININYYYTQDGQKLIGSVSDSSGRGFDIEYNKRSLGYIYEYRISAVTEKTTGRKATYEYIDTYVWGKVKYGILCQVTDPTGKITKYSHGSADFTISENEVVTEKAEYNYTYGSDVPQRVRKVTDIYGNMITYDYDIVLGKLTETDNNKRATTTWFDSMNYPIRTRDAEGNETRTEYLKYGGANMYGEPRMTVDKSSNTTYYDRDNRGNIIRQINPDRSVKEFAYDEKNNLIFEKDEEGNCKYYEYDANKINLVKLAIPLNGTDAYSASADQSKFAITEYQYGTKGTIKGLLMKETTPEGDANTYTYDNYGNIATKTNALGITTSYTYNAANWLTMVKDGNNQTTKFYYDKAGRLLKTVYNYSNVDETRERMIYDARGLLAQKISAKQYNYSNDTAFFDSQNIIFSGGAYNDNTVGYRYTYNAIGQLTSEKDPNNFATSYAYDIYNNKITETKPNGTIYSSEYDFLNRPTKNYYKANGSGSTPKQLLTEYSYNTIPGGESRTEMVYFSDSATDKAATTYIYDYAGRQTKQDNPDGSNQTVDYYANGQIKRSIDGRRFATYYTYDGLGNITDTWRQVNSSQYRYSGQEYDKAGRPLLEKYGKSLVPFYDLPADTEWVAYAYNADDTLAEKTTSAGGKVSYTYDNIGNILSETVAIDSEKSGTTKYTYDYAGRVLSKTQNVEAESIGESPDGLVGLITSYTYDLNGNVLTTTNAAGIKTGFTYDAMDRLLSTSMPGLDENNNATEIVTSATYDWTGNVLTATDAKGSVTTNTYTPRGWLMESKNALGGITHYEYDLDGRNTVQISAKNYIAGQNIANLSRTETAFDSMGRVDSISEKYQDGGSWKTIVSEQNTYDAAGNIIRRLDGMGNAVTYAYDGLNSLTSLTDAEGNTVRFEYDGLGHKVCEYNAKDVATEYVYDGAGNILLVSTAGQLMAANTYDLVGNVLTVTDALGATVTNTYDLLGQPRTSWVAGGENVETYQQNHWYDRLGRVIRQADSLGKCTMYTYNNQGQLLTSREEGVNGEIPISQSMRYDKNGNLCYATDPLGNTTEMTYDDLNRLSSVKVDVTNINGVTASQTTSYTYDANGNKLTEKDYLGNSKTYTYDPLNRLSEGYDELGNLVEKLEYNDNHLQIRSTDALGNATEFFYDKNNRQTATKDALGNTSYTGYDPCGNVASQTDPLGNITRYTYDDFNNLTQVRNALGETTGYTYDPAGNPLSQTDGKGNTLNFAYNTRGLLIRRIEADGIGDGGGIDPEKLTTYSYNGAGQLTRRLDRNGVESSSFYDLHGRLIKEITGDDTVTYSYDAAGNQLTMADSTGITTRAYDQLGRVISKTVPKIGASTYLYEDLSEITTDPLGNITGKKLDKAGRIAEVDGTNYTYYKNGNLQSVVYPGGAREDYTYYANNQLHTLSNSVAGSIIEAYNYAYDAAGNMTTKLDVKGQTNYKYDELNRLKEVTEPNGRNIKYVYDKAGNRLTEQVITGEEEELTEYTYDEQNRLLFTTKTADKTVTITNYSYDNNGNMLSELTEELIDDNGQEGALGLSILGGGGLEGAVLYEYDARNRLVRVITGENTIANTYNGEGRRIAKATNGNTHHYIYDYDKIVLETDDTGQEVAHNVYGLALVSRTVDGETLKYLYNGHGDVTALVSGSTVIGGYYYDAFGVIVEETGNANNPYRFSGYEYDTETMLYNLQARFYKAGIARFLQEDTYYGNWKDPLSLNLYTYCSNSPLKYWDPTGHKQETITIQLSDGTTTKGYLDNGKVYFPNDKGGRSAAVYGTKFYYNGGTYQYNNSGLKLIASDNKTGAPPPAAKPTTPPPAAQANIGTNKNTGNNSNSNSPGNLIDKGFNFVDKLINNGADKATAFIDKTSNKAKTEIRKATNNLDPNIASKINSFGDGFIDFFAGQATGYIEAQRDFTLDSVDQLRTPGGLVNVLTGNALATPAVNSFVKFAESSSAATADKPFLENMLTTALTGKGDFLAATHIEMAKGLIAGDYDRVAYAAGGGAAQALEIAAFVGIGELVGAVGGRAAVGESQIVVGETRVVAGESRAMIGEARTPTSRLPGATIDSATGREVGRFVVDPKGNIMIEPVGGSTVPAGKGGIDTHTLYPNGSNYQRLNPNGHTTNPTPHGHGHLQGFGPGMKGQGLSTDIFGNTVPWNSADAHWPISR